MTIDEYLADPASRFATVAMVDTNGLLRGQMVSAGSLRGIARNGMGMSPVTLALDPTDVVQVIPGISDGSSDFHDDPLVIDPATTRRLPWSKPGHDMLVLANYSGGTAELCPRSILKRVLDRAGEAGLRPRYGMELEYTLFDETPSPPTIHLPVPSSWPNWNGRIEPSALKVCPLNAPALVIRPLVPKFP